MITKNPEMGNLLTGFSAGIALALDPDFWGKIISVGVTVWVGYSAYRVNRAREKEILSRNKEREERLLGELKTRKTD